MSADKPRVGKFPQASFGQMREGSAYGPVSSSVGFAVDRTAFSSSRCVRSVVRALQASGFQSLNEENCPPLLTVVKVWFRPLPKSVQPSSPGSKVCSVEDISLGIRALKSGGVREGERSLKCALLIMLSGSQGFKRHQALISAELPSDKVKTDKS